MASDREAIFIYSLADRRSLQAALPFLHLPFRFVLGDSISLLNAARELLLLPFDHVKIVFRELAPLLLDLTLGLLPAAFNSVPIHHPLLQITTFLLPLTHEN